MRASHRKRRPSTARRWRSDRSWPTTTPPSPPIPRAAWQEATIDLGRLLSNTGKSSEAEAEYRKALAILQKLADDNPAITSIQSGLAYSLRLIGWQLAQAGKTDEAIGYYTREEAIRQKLAEASSATPEDRDSLANCQTNTADVLRRSGRLDEALAACERALAVREPLVEAHPEVPRYRAGLGETYLRLGQVRCDMENLAGAAAAWKRALRELRRLQVPERGGCVLPGLLPRRPGGTRGPAGLGSVRRGGGGPGREGDGHVAPGGHAGLPQTPTLTGPNRPSTRSATGPTSGH